MTLFFDPSCPYCHRVRIVLAEKGIAVDIVDVDANHLPEEVLEFSPYGAVPCLVDRDLRLYESRIIMEYLDERFPHPPLLPVDPVARANARLYMYRVERDWFSLMGTIAKGDPAAAEKARKELRDSLITTAPVFGAKRFFMSDEISLVDCCIAPMLYRLPVLGIELPAQAKEIHDYTKRIFKWPAFKASLTEAEHEMIADLR
jgi:RNA polymerase-associated protein